MELDFDKKEKGYHVYLPVYKEAEAPIARVFCLSE